MTNQLDFTPWARIARMCPLKCEVSHVTEEDYVDAEDEDGNPCKKAVFNFVPGTLTAVEESFHWRFNHPGFKNGSFRIHALRCDEIPGYSGINLR